MIYLKFAFGFVFFGMALFALCAVIVGAWADENVERIIKDLENGKSEIER